MVDMYRKTPIRQAPASAPPTAPSSPRRQQEVGVQEPDLCKSLFVIDRQGSRPVKTPDSKTESKNASLISSTPRLKHIEEVVNDFDVELKSSNIDEDMNSTSVLENTELDNTSNGKSMIKSKNDESKSGKGNYIHGKL
jgi:hypothetical protein